MPVRTMREVQPGEVPLDGGTAVQDNPERPVFRGNGEYDYVCVSCGNVLAAGMDPAIHDPPRTGQVRPLPHRQHRRRGLRAGGAAPEGERVS